MLIFNKGRVMSLPQGVSKATGLRIVLASLRVSARNMVAIGDAENDHELLRLAEAEPSSKITRAMIEKVRPLLSRDVSAPAPQTETSPSAGGAPPIRRSLRRRCAASEASGARNTAPDPPSRIDHPTKRCRSSGP